ncbi:MAG: SMI1/KNR4 family protein, partial [Candidatus Aenigmarchaeota archaeon]|nr:SMI1/KNR4 family protein [Candidatus Aenigmarchaeota archaeon]
KKNTTAVPAAKIKELRNRTGIGLTDCKKALTESNGSIDEAVKYLCRKGLASSDKEQGKDAIHVLQKRTGADYKNCKQAIAKCDGNIEKAVIYLSEKGLVLLESEFLIWQDDHNDYIAYIDGPVNVPESYMLGEGISFEKQWSSHARYETDMETENSLYINLGDCMHDYPPVISNRLKCFLEKNNVSDIEFLPVRIRDSKRKQLAADYYVMNPVGVIECINIESSQVKWNTIDTDMISSCEKLVLDEHAIPSGIQIFRPKHMSHLILIRKKLAIKILESEFTGLSFSFPLTYTGAGGGTSFKLDSDTVKNISNKTESPDKEIQDTSDKSTKKEYKNNYPDDPVKTAEQQYGKNLPKEYRTFLKKKEYLKYLGMCPESLPEYSETPQVFFIAGEDIIGMKNGKGIFADCDAEDIRNKLFPDTDSYFKKEYLQKIVAFARLGWDDYLDVPVLALDISGQDTCPVLLWTSSGNFTVVQDSIKEFLEDLVPYNAET